MTIKIRSKRVACKVENLSHCSILGFGLIGNGPMFILCSHFFLWVPIN